MQMSLVGRDSDIELCLLTDSRRSEKPCMLKLAYFHHALISVCRSAGWSQPSDEATGDITIRTVAASLWSLSEDADSSRTYS